MTKPEELEAAEESAEAEAPPESKADEIARYRREWDEHKISRYRPAPERNELRELVHGREEPPEVEEPAESPDEFTPEELEPFERMAQGQDIEATPLDLAMAARAERDEINHFLDEVLEEIPAAKGVPRDALVGLLRAAYLEDFSLERAWDGRFENPEAVAPAMQPYVQGIVDSYGEWQRAEDHRTVAAVRRARTSPGRSPTSFGDLDFSRMSDDDFVRTKEEIFLAARRGQL